MINYENKVSIYQSKNAGFNKYVYELIEKKPQKILDLGCGVGTLGKALIQDKQSEVYGLDIAKGAIDIAIQNMTDAKAYNIESDAFPYDIKFDTIILADILEHLREPEKALNILEEHLHKDGNIVISIPNIANINIRRNLFWGNWDYTDRGIMDATHLKFFTEKTLTQMIHNTGFKITKKSSTPGFSFFVLRKFSPLIKLRNYLCSLYPRLFSTQFVYVIKKSNVS